MIPLQKYTQSGGLCSGWLPDCERQLSRMFQGNGHAGFYAEFK